MVRFAFMVVVLAFLARVGLASDGVLEINQTCATSSAGCFPGDAAGFPVTITQTGSYRLTGNLTVPANTTAIRIETANVKVNLGGFEVKGPNVCTGYPVTSCTLQGGAPGIYAPTVNEVLVSVRNGTVIGMAGPCIELQGNSSNVDQVTAYYCGASAAETKAGIQVGDYGRVSQCHSSNNRGYGVKVGAAGMISDNELRGNSGCGAVALSATIRDNRVVDQSCGIFGDGGSLVTRNLVVAPSLIISGVSLGDNLCNGVRC